MFRSSSVDRKSVSSKFVVPALVAVCLLSSQALIPVASASTVRTDTPVHVMPAASGKTVTLTLANAGAEPLKVQIGDWTATIDPGKSLSMKVPVGAKIINAEATKTHAAGEVLSQVTKSLAGATLRVG